jgi:DNA-binding NtrC family response regulator
MAKVLVVDDEANIRNALSELLKSWGHEVVQASTYHDATAALQSNEMDTAFVDVMLPDGSGIDIIRECREKGNSVPIVILTGHGTIEDAVNAIRLGAEDYLTKPVEPPRLKIILEKVVEKREMEDEVRSLRRQLRKAGTVGSLIGRSAPMQQLYTLIERVAPTDAAVFITGESGTGKTLISKTIHDYSKRRKKPFVAVNCAAIAPTLIESELFGHEKGAFTGATQQRRGFFEEANGGTILLDEITELPIELQGKLLRVLEENRIRRVGGNVEMEINVRLISATNRDPKQAVADGKLREDLYYRINIFPIHAPSLREHRDDIPFLAQIFLEKICDDEGRPHATFHTKVVEILKNYDWPGNVRELRNVINRAVIIAREDVITQECLPDYLRAGIGTGEVNRLDSEELPEQAEEVVTVGAVAETAGVAGKASASPRRGGFTDSEVEPSRGPQNMTLEDMEKMMIRRLLTETENNKPLVAEKLGISLKTLYNKIKKYDL